MKLGLDAIDCVCERLGRPERRVPCVLVAGTNGKGSTAATLAAIAAAAGLRTGLYTSPHLDRRHRADPHRPDGHRAGRARRRARRGVRGGRPGARRAADLLRGDDRGGVPRSSRGAGSTSRCSRSGLGGRLDATNVAPASPVAGDVHRARPHGGSRRDARGDRRREGGHLSRGPAGARGEPAARGSRRLRRGRGRTGARAPPHGRRDELSRGRPRRCPGTRFELDDARRPLRAGDAAARRSTRPRTRRSPCARRSSARIPGCRIGAEAIGAGRGVRALAGAPRAVLGPRRGRSSWTAATTRRAPPRWPASSRGGPRGGPRLRRDGGQGRRGHRARPSCPRRRTRLASSRRRRREPRRRRSSCGASRPAGRSRAAAAGLEAALESCSSDPACEPIIVAGSLYLVGEARALLLSGTVREDDRDDRRRAFTREHFERLEEERLALYASKSAPRGPAPRGRVAERRATRGRTTPATATASSTPARSAG